MQQQTWFPTERTTRIAKLEDGTLVPYDQCCKPTMEPSYPHPKYGKLVYLGKGVIYSINGIKQVGAETFKFYKFND